jgi:tryptophanyl-tRNA synthetase
MTTLDAVRQPAASQQTRKKTVLSGIQPTGTLHIGNYVGALSVWVEKQHEFQNLFMIANLHALTIPEAVQPDMLRRKAREVAALYIACGIDPHESVIFLQSDIPAHPYLAWVLGCCTPVGWLERMTQYKTKAAQTDSVSSGLLNYPALQAADILAYKADYVPVGDDQNQHVEITRDIAQRFNHLFGQYFPIPETLNRSSGARIMGLDDPTAKMSKSLAGVHKGHAISLLDDASTIKKSIMSAVTDTGSETRFEYASPGVKNLLVLYEIISGDSRPAIEERFAGKGYGYLKRELVERVIQTLQPIQAKFHEITGDSRQLDDLLAEGAAKASRIANQTLSDVRQMVGV